MNKTELVAGVAEKAGLTKKDAEKAVNALFESVQQELIAGGKVQMIGFGTFEVKERAARKGRNPRTGQDIEIPASKNPVFKAGKALKDAVNG
ncbi:MAG: HU family DNA-binding protein [Selenomonas sp.]|nr:HU family DNA-binding protein [Selenomonas sp.]